MSSVLDAVERIAPLPVSSSRNASIPDHELKVLIVGGSIAGLTLALALLRSGWPASSVSVFERTEDGRRGGAGVTIDGLTVAILKGLGLFDSEEAATSWAGMPLYAELAASGHVLDRTEAFGSFAIHWEKLYLALRGALPEGIVQYEKRLARIERPSGGGVTTHFDDGSSAEGSLLVGSDGSASAVRNACASAAGWAGPLAWRGYFTWRGVLPSTQCPPAVEAALRSAYPDLGRCLYFVTTDATLAVGGRPQHFVLYELGGGLLNWVLYKE